MRESSQPFLNIIIIIIIIIIMIRIISDNKNGTIWLGLRGTTSERSCITTRPAASPPIDKSKNTYKKTTTTIIK
jgi:hypothetical protein